MEGSVLHLTRIPRQNIGAYLCIGNDLLTRIFLSFTFSVFPFVVVDVAGEEKQRDDSSKGFLNLSYSLKKQFVQRPMEFHPVCPRDSCYEFSVSRLSFFLFFWMAIRCDA